MKTVEVTAAIIRHEDKILATQRGYGDFEGGWEFPGGKVEPGETPRQTIVREIQEELHITIEPLECIATVEYDYPTFHLKMHCFVSAIRDGHMELTEHEALRWLAPGELDEPAWLPADVLVVEKLKAWLARN